MPMYFCILIDIFPYIQYVQHLVQNENENSIISFILININMQIKTIF